MTSPSVFHERRIACAADPIAVAAALAASTTDEFVVYENEGEVGWGESPYALVSTGVGATTLTVEGTTRTVATGPRPLDAVARALADVEVTGWRAYGWLAFELSHVLHGTGPASGVGVRTDDPPIAQVAVPRREIRLTEGEALLRALAPDDLDHLEVRLAAAVSAADAPAREDRIRADVHDHGADDYRAAVAASIAAISTGQLDKVIVSRPVPVPEPIDLPATYLAGRRGNDPARSFLLRLGGWQVAGFSPEIVARVTRDGTVTTQPLAGTRALAGDRTADRTRREELYRDAKEVFEHAISVRLACAELATVCTEGSGRIDDFMAVKERGSVQHLASRLSGRLSEGRTAWDAVAALFPAVTASGIPKSQACALIHRLEAEPRGLYSGSVLTVDADGTVDAALVLRSVFRHGERTWLRAGAGVVAHSTPERELEETREKLYSVSRFLVPERVDPTGDTEDPQPAVLTAT
ncbi:salicylate synthase [Embleya scabrispora]|uniref:salicylate synthase n=1 Tax=Embleya scabrispora TaxID=159449 RepID=UPI0003645BD8|nr:salicylate synthase [Embleya scabrispora]MYS80895.1 salicylate synthase [Streptomyces sp. SID5474]